MNAIPLSAPDGRVYTYACGRCNVFAGGVGWFTCEPPDERMVERFKEDAEACCRCDDCEIEIKKAFLSSRCKPCEAKREEKLALVMAEQSAKAQRMDEAFAERLRLATGGEAALQLREAMRDISEDYYCAGWLMGLEDSLWGMLNGADRRFGTGTVREDEIEKLRSLHLKAGGWWQWDDALGGEMFVPTAEWNR